MYNEGHTNEQVAAALSRSVQSVRSRWNQLRAPTSRDMNRKARSEAGLASKPDVVRQIRELLQQGNSWSAIFSLNAHGCSHANSLHKAYYDAVKKLGLPG